MAVNRCICCEQDFAVALPVARKFTCTTVAGLQEHIEISTGCGLCIPYVQRMVETGETDLPVLSPDEAQELIWRSGTIGTRNGEG